jgi:hypothetical protein
MVLPIQNFKMYFSEHVNIWDAHKKDKNETEVSEKKNIYGN